MESIFENLENLNVSEECFDEIMGIVESIVSYTLKNVKDPEKKRRLLHKEDIARELNLQQFEGSKKGGKAVWDDYKKYAPKIIGRYGTPLEVPGYRATKNQFGMTATSQRTSDSRKSGQPFRRVKNYRLNPIPSDEEASIATNKSIARHDKKNK